MSKQQIIEIELLKFRTFFAEPKTDEPFKYAMLPTGLMGTSWFPQLSAAQVAILTRVVLICATEATNCVQLPDSVLTKYVHDRYRRLTDVLDKMQRLGILRWKAHASKKERKKVSNSLRVIKKNCESVNNFHSFADSRSPVNKTGFSTQRIEEEIYKHYPKKVGKTEGIKKLRKQLKTEEDFQACVKAVGVFAAECAGKDSQYIKQFSTWVNQECWRDCLDDDYGEDKKVQEGWEEIRRADKQMGVEPVWEG